MNSDWSMYNSGNNGMNGSGSNQQMPAPGRPRSFTPRTSPNFFSAACGLAYVLCFLLLPFARIALFFPAPGLLFIKVNPLMYIPIILGVMMLIAAFVFDKKVNMLIGGVTALITIIMLACAQLIFVNGSINVVLPLIEVILGRSVGETSSISMLSNAIPFRAGLGGVFCILLCVLYVVLECVLSDDVRRVSQTKANNPWPSV